MATARRHLVAHRADGGRRWPDEGEPGGRAGLGEARVLGEEAIARMHGLGAGPPGGCDQLVDDEIALDRRSRADRHRLIGEQDVEGLAVDLGEDRDGGNPKLAAGPDDPDGDLAAIRDEDLPERGAHVAGILAGVSKPGQRGNPRPT
jgi:hypothetical protein